MPEIKLNFLFIYFIQDDKDLDNLTWHDIQKQIRKAQLELQMCIHKPELTELDIYLRILR